MSSLRTCRLSPLRVGDLDLMRKSISDWAEILPRQFNYIRDTDFLDSKSTFKSLIVDNLLVGLIYTPLMIPILDPWAYCFGYLDKVNLAEAGIDKSTDNKTSGWFEQVSRGIVDTRNLDPVMNIPIHQDGSVKTKSVLILGPVERNKALLGAIEQRGYSVTVSDKEPAFIMREGLSRYSRIFSSGYAFKIPRSFLDQVDFKVLNFHATFLPWGRGIGTVLFDALFGHPTGYTIHEINDGLDTGDVIYRRAITQCPADTTRSYYRKVIGSLNDFVIANIDALLSSDLIGTSQSELTAAHIPYTSRFNFERLIRLLPDGYDTALSTLSELGGLVALNVDAAARIRLHLEDSADVRQ